MQIHFLQLFTYLRLELIQLILFKRKHRFKNHLEADIIRMRLK